MKKELSKEEIRKELEELDFISPFGKVFVILFNPSYDMGSYSLEIERINMEKFIGLDQINPTPANDEYTETTNGYMEYADAEIAEMTFGKKMCKECLAKYIENEYNNSKK